MKEFFPVIRSAPLFSGISEEELTVMLSCLRAEKRVFPKGAFVLRAGDTADSIGLVLSGTVLVIQEDIWGKPQYSFQSRAGADLCRRICLRYRFQAECERHSGNACHRNVSECKAHFERVSVRLFTPQSDHPESSRRACREKSAAQRETHAHGAAHNSVKNHVLPFRRGAAAREIRI